MFEVQGVEVGGKKPYFISEIGSNHGGSIDTAERLIDVSASCGADAVKFQVRSNTELYTRDFYERPYDSENAFGTTYGAHREALELDVTQLAHLSDYAKDKGLACFATAFDFTAVDICANLFPAIKLASGSLTNTPLLTYAAKTGLPLFISTGGAKIGDVDRAIDAVWDWNQKVCLLQATASYPCKWEELDLAVINTYMQRYPSSVIGLSSHVPGISEGPAAYVMGARVFEKHITLSRASKGTDHAFSLEPNGLRRYIRDLRRCEVMIGDGCKRLHLSEVEPVMKMGAGVYTGRDLHAGHVLQPQDVVIKSPAGPIPPYELTKVIGLELVQDLQEETPLDWSLLASAVKEERNAV